MERADAEAWIRSHVEPVGPIEVHRARAWSTVLRVPVAGGVVWFKACGAGQLFEPALSVKLFARWPDRVGQVLAHDAQRAWLVLADAGSQLDPLGNPPEAWLEVLPRYAELQRGESAHADEHLSNGVPDLRVETLPAQYDALVKRHLPLNAGEVHRLQRFAPGFRALCTDLAARAIPVSVQHDDLRGGSVYRNGAQLRVLDWGDASISHPFASLVVTFRFLEEINGLEQSSPWFARLRDAYLEPWGSGLRDTFDLAVRVGLFAHCIAWMRQRDALPPDARPDFDSAYRIILRRAVARIN